MRVVDPRRGQALPALHVEPRGSLSGRWEDLKLVVAGGIAGPFTALIPGWPLADSPARLVLRKIAA